MCLEENTVIHCVFKMELILWFFIFSSLLLSWRQWGEYQGAEIISYCPGWLGLRHKESVLNKNIKSLQHDDLGKRDKPNVYYICLVLEFFFIVMFCTVFFVNTDNRWEDKDTLLRQAPALLLITWSVFYKQILVHLQHYQTNGWLGRPCACKFCYRASFLSLAL